ncbi:omega-6 fatty acid desaturase (delta-12 desaturase) [Aliiruegeria haliotis]|uniref:Omega-6 fatty acid desaturase (Delta-12 desaturase) n=1 Tax=Aliiruegeria haliotis TaxID=1280846 RepID=A0A2T0RWK7_9RHOB|nr:fatty acid desaturase [Aliiruegeria haliotis]PRY25575.1 omega-6 fatty acid desaturase (delta-12 desaturase) [Aliiruegeria haliotis]
MTESTGCNGSQPSPAKASDWIRVLANYREPNDRRSTFELAVTAIPFAVFWGLAWYALSISHWLALAISLLIAPFLLRLFAIQHDCGHGSFFRNRVVSDWVGRCLGVLTLTPYDVWRRAHAIHHSAAGNLNRRGMGDILTLTTEEYAALSPVGRLKYRLYRHPITLFGIGPSYVFLLENRLPLGFMDGAKYWISSMGTNLAILVAAALIWYLGGAMPLLLIFLPSTLIAATAGVWLFYVQHQFEHTQWESEPDWQVHESALHGSSHYVLPPVLQWVSANIGIHHVHHLYSRIPFYRLPEVLKDHAILAESNRMTIRQSLSTVKLKLWDTESKRLVTFSEARALQG